MPIPAPPPKPPPRKNHLPFIVIGVVLALAVGVICCAAVGLFYWNRTRNQATAAIPAATPIDVPTPAPTIAPTFAAPLTGAACLVGNWRETSSQSDSSIGGETVRLTASGAIQKFTADGTNTVDLGAGVTKTGKQSGNTYTVISTGTLTYRYQVIGNQIHYSDAQASGTTVWKRNGKQIDKQQLKGTIGADTFICTGDKLVEYGDGYTIELSRVVG